MLLYNFCYLSCYRDLPRNVIVTQIIVTKMMIVHLVITPLESSVKRVMDMLVNVTMLRILVNLKDVNMENFVDLALRVTTFDNNGILLIHMPINFDVIEIDGIAHYMRNCREDIGEVCAESHHPSVRINWQLYNLKKV